MATKEEREALLKRIDEEYAPELLAEADDSLKADREFMLEAVEVSGETLEYADDSLKADREVVFEAVTSSGSALQYAAKSLKADREFILEVVKQVGYALPYADDSLKADREIVMEAVKQNGEVLEYAADSLKADREVVLAAVEQSGEALEYADDSLKSDREFMLEAVKQHSSEGPRIFAQQKANTLLHELRAYLEPEAFDQFLDAEEGSDSYRINCVYEKGDGNSEYAEWYDNREIVFFPTWRLTYDLFWVGDPHGHSTFKGTKCEVLLDGEEALDDFVNWVKERVDWEELEENWNNVMADGSLKANIVVEPLFQVEA